MPDVEEAQAQKVHAQAHSQAQARAPKDVEMMQNAALHGLLEMHRRGDYAAMYAASPDYVSAATTAARVWLVACRKGHFHAPCGSRYCAHDACIADVTASAMLACASDKIPKSVERRIGKMAFFLRVQRRGV